MGRRNRRGQSIHGILLFDKPAGGSSNQVLQRVRHRFDAKKAGHTGSLDPLATGMLPICFGEATKLGAYLLDADKSYRTTLQLGVTTDSADADGQVLERRPIPVTLDRSAFTDVATSFIGNIAQVPPMVSALKVDGQRLYALARAGVTVEREPRMVSVHSLEVEAFDGSTATLSVRCSKGTYIRSLVSDIGESIGCGAHVSSLRRTGVTPFDGLPMTAWDALCEMSPAERLGRLLPVDAGIGHLPSLEIDAAMQRVFTSGQPVVGEVRVPGTEAMASSPWRVYGPDARFLGLAERDDRPHDATDDGAAVAGGMRVCPRRVMQWDD